MEEDWKFFGRWVSAKLKDSRVKEAEDGKVEEMKSSTNASEGEKRSWEIVFSETSFHLKRYPGETS